MRRKNFLLMILPVFLLVFLYSYDKLEKSFGQEKADFNPENYMNSIIQNNKDVSQAMRTTVQPIISKYGITSAQLLIKEAFKQKKIDFWECHSLLHMIGHQAYKYYKKDLQKISQENLMICGNAFQHGVEAEIAILSKNPIPELYQYCQALKTRKTNILCYHGAGHAYMHNLQNLENALELCDRLKEGPTTDIEHCYTGVFSDYTLSLYGIDGDTGLHIPGRSFSRVPFDHPLGFCQTFSPTYQYACAFQISRILYVIYSKEEALKKCIIDKYPNTLKEACLRAVSAVMTRHELYYNNNLVIPSFIHKWSDNLRREFIWGVAKEFRMLLDSGLKKDKHEICSNFQIESDREICIRRLND